jgi:ATP-dependent Zn protease
LKKILKNEKIILTDCEFTHKVIHIQSDKGGRKLKKSLLIVIFLLIYTHIHSVDFTSLSVGLSNPRNIRSNNIENFVINVWNRGDTVINNLELSVTHNEYLISVLDQTRIDTLEPRETVRINVEISNNLNYFFDKNTYLSVKIFNEEHESNYSFRLTIKPIENLWFFIILSLMSIIIFLFIIVYIKLNKGEKNVG